jgi:hypothetical protein
MDVQDFYDRAPDLYRQELLKYKLTPETREASLKKFAQSLKGTSQMIAALRDADVRRGKAMLKLITFLDANWGTWNYNPATKQLVFQGAKLTDQYKQALQQLKNATTELMRFQAEDKRLSNTNS